MVCPRQPSCLALSFPVAYAKRKHWSITESTPENKVTAWQPHIKDLVWQDMFLAVQPHVTQTAPLWLPIFLRPKTHCPETEACLKVPVCWLCWVGSRLAKTDTPSLCSERGQIARHSEQVSSLEHTDLPFSQKLLGIASEEETRSESGPVCVRLVRKTLWRRPPGRSHGLPAR